MRLQLSINQLFNKKLSHLFLLIIFLLHASAGFAQKEANWWYFTPNNDDVNDLFALDHTCPFDNYKIVIYDRWGRLMFSLTDFELEWD